MRLLKLSVCKPKISSFSMRKKNNNWTTIGSHKRKEDYEFIATLNSQMQFREITSNQIQSKSKQIQFLFHSNLFSADGLWLWEANKLRKKIPQTKIPVKKRSLKMLLKTNQLEIARRWWRRQLSDVADDGQTVLRGNYTSFSPRFSNSSSVVTKQLCIVNCTSSKK